MIPVRLGSKRVKNKNLRYLGDKPLVAHVLETCCKLKVFNEIYLNSESLIFKKIAQEYGISFYHRHKKFAEPDITNDLFVEDFLMNIECDYLVQINSTAPFLSSDNIQSFTKKLVNGKYDTLQAVKEERIESIFNGEPLNFDPCGIMPESQNLEPIFHFTSGMHGFKRKTYLENMHKYGAGTYGCDGKIGYFPIKGFSTIDIDEEEDFRLAEVIYKLFQQSHKYPKYYQGK